MQQQISNPLKEKAPCATKLVPAAKEVFARLVNIRFFNLHLVNGTFSRRTRMCKHNFPKRDHRKIIATH